LFFDSYISYRNLWDRSQLNLFISRRPCQYSSLPLLFLKKRVTIWRTDRVICRTPNKRRFLELHMIDFQDSDSLRFRYWANAKRTCPSHFFIATHCQRHCLLSVVAITVIQGLRSPGVVASEYVRYYNRFIKTVYAN